MLPQVRAAEADAANAPGPNRGKSKLAVKKERLQRRAILIHKREGRKVIFVAASVGSLRGRRRRRRKFPAGKEKKKKTKERKWRGKLCRRGGKISFPVVGGMWRKRKRGFPSHTSFCASFIQARGGGALGVGERAAESGGKGLKSWIIKPTKRRGGRRKRGGTIG